MTVIAQQLRALAAAGRRYACLLADPPWAFKTYSGDRVPQRAKAQHYDTMTEAELSALPVAEVLAEDALMQMWVLGTHVDQALRIGERWGMTYSSLGLIWKKMSRNGLGYVGLGHWYRTGGEVSILFTRGSPTRLDRGVRQFIESPVREHSRKPEGQYERIERLVSGPRLELFARQRRPGWDVAGNEVHRFGATPPKSQAV